MARILILLLVANLAAAEKYLWPLPDSRTLTGGYADSRSDHFHGGVDLRARTPLPVIAPTDGWVERIAVNPGGYGLTLYFRLSDGMTAVFGHLSRYESALQEVVRDSQLVAGTYRIDFSYADETSAPHYGAGDVLCYTGATGRGPAHLHFEIRDGAVQLDPLKFYKPADTQQPVIVGVNWIRLSENIPGSSGQSLALNASPRISSDEPLALLIRTYDPGPWGRNAVPSALRVFVDSELIYEEFPAQIDLQGPQDIYEQLVYREFKHNDRDVRRLFHWTARELTDSMPLPAGWIDGFSGKVRIEVEDRNGNIATVSIPVTAGSTRRATGLRSSTAANSFSLTGDDVGLSWAEVSTIGNECRINDEDFAFPAKLVLTSETDFEPGLYWYKRSGAAGKSPLWRIPTDGYSVMSCYVLRGGTYGIAVDDTPPVLSLFAVGGKIKFKLTDDDSAIDDSSVRSEIDGETAIPEFEYEENGGSIWTARSLSRGKHTVDFEAMNRAGLYKSWSVSVTIP
ncbi:MAG: M23 family metallopeptidase [bacterium]|nr:M23 family metallopeptidase [bacterium]